MKIIEFKSKKNKEFIDTNHNNILIEEENKIAIGIDLGTTHSVVSYFKPYQKKPEILSYENSYLVPSLLYYDKNNDEIYVGEKAKKYLDTCPQEVIKSTKKYMGKSDAYFFSNGCQFSAEDVAYEIIQYLVSHEVILEAKKKSGEIYVVVTVPAHFHDAARSATLQAAQKAGLHVLRIINEPTSAALAYSFLSNYQNIQKDYLSVFDFGGGTFDVTILERNNKTFQVLSTLGNRDLGGDNIDEAIADFLCSFVEPKQILKKLDKNSKLYRKLLIHAETAKKILQEQGCYLIQDENLDGNHNSIHYELHRDVFQELCLDIIQKTIFLTENAMKQAHISPKKISKILLVGGSTRLKLIRESLETYFPCEVDGSLEPDLSVSLGASLQAAILLGIHFDTILIDVCSHSLGIGVVGSEEEIQEIHKKVAQKMNIPYPISDAQMARLLGNRLGDFRNQVLQELSVQHILPKNSPLPSKKSEFFTTIHDDQFGVQVVVVQGEGFTVRENKLIGSFFFETVQPCPKGTQCEIQLTYDINGMVHVYAKQLNTKNEARAIFDSRTSTVVGWENSHSASELNSYDLFENSEIASFAAFSNKKIKPLHLNKQQNKQVNTAEEDKNNKDDNSFVIMNSTVMKIKKILKEWSLQENPKKEMLQIELDHYLNLLNQSHQGKDVDQLLDDSENKMKDLIEEKNL